MSSIVNAQSRVRKARINDIKGTGVIPVEQSVAVIGMNSYITIDIRPTPATNSINNGNDLLFDLEPHDAFNIKDIMLRMKVSVTSAIDTVPAPYWIKRIRLLANKGSGDELMKIYPEQIIQHYAQMDDERREFFRRNGHIGLYEDSQQIIVTSPPTLQSGDSKEIYIPFPQTFLNMNAIQLMHMREDIRIRIELNSDFVVSGTAANFSLDGVSVLIAQDELDDNENRQWVQESMRAPQYYNYLDVLRIDENAKTLTAGSETKFDLQNAFGKSPFVLSVHKPAATPIASDKSLYTYSPVGDAGLWELKSPNNEPLLGKGSSIRSDYLQYLHLVYFGTKPVKGMYVLPFCHDPASAVDGVVDGYFQFDGSKDQLSVIYPAAPTQEVHTFTLTNLANDLGVFRLQIGGESTDYLSAIATVGDLKTAVEALKPMSDHGYEVTFDSTFGSGTPVLATFDATDGRVSDEIGPMRFDIATMNDGGTLEIGTSAVSTYGVDGWTTGAGYKHESFVYYFKRLKISKDGRLSCRTL